MSLLLSLSLLTTSVAADSILLGQAHDRVVALDASNWRAAIQDPANPLWLLKFYAPWCGHCKRLAPVLDQVAPTLQGKLAIGKIDCTTDKKVCDVHKVRGYPTLKFSLDGEVYDYPGGRSADDIMGFADKMNQPAVRNVATVAEIWTYAQQQGAPVVFVASGGATTSEDSLVLQVFAQVARKQRAVDHFLQLAPDAPNVVADLQLPATVSPSLPFVCRLEEKVAPVCVEDVADMTADTLQEFVRTHNFPTVAQLGPHNFNKIGRAGKPLVIGVVDTSQPTQMATVKEGLTKYATQGTHRDAYYYGWLDGRQWSKFLAQFNVQPQDSPQVFILNVPDKTFWQNATYGANVQAFLNAVQDGTVTQGSAGAQGMEKSLQEVYHLMVEYRPWSVILVVLLVVAIAVLIASCVSPPTTDEYAHRVEDVMPPPSTEPPEKKNETKENATKDETEDIPESKKDK